MTQMLPFTQMTQRKVLAGALTILVLCALLSVALDLKNNRRWDVIPLTIAAAASLAAVWVYSRSFG